MTLNYMNEKSLDLNGFKNSSLMAQRSSFEGDQSLRGPGTDRYMQAAE